MDDEPNIYISNGTCYSAQGSEAGASMLPCGNDYFGHAACCQASDNCLLSSVCYNGEFGTTYVAGCTDPDYEDEVCPDKFDAVDSPWLGMAYCNGTSNEWVLCEQDDRPATLTKGDACACPTATASRTMTLAQENPINLTAVLPSSLGQTIQFQVGYYPTSPTTTTTTTATTSQRPDSSFSSSSFTSSSHPAEVTANNDAGGASSPNNGRLSTSETVGVAVGASVVGILLLASLAFLFVLRRRRKEGEDDEEDDDGSKTGTTPTTQQQGGGGHAHASSNVGDIGVAYGGDNSNNNNNEGGHVVHHGGFSDDDGEGSSRVSELENKAARPWSMGSELEAGGGPAHSPVSWPGRMDSIVEQQQAGGSHRGGGGGGGSPSEWPGAVSGPRELHAREPLVELPA